MSASNHMQLCYQSHTKDTLTPLLILLSSLLYGFCITFVHLEFIHHKLSKAHEVDFFSDARESGGLDIHYTTISDGFPVKFDRELHFEEYWESMLRDFPAIVDEFVGKTIQLSDQYSAHFLVSDTFNYWWSANIAEKYNLVNVALWTEPALVFSLVYHSHLLSENGHFPCKDNIVEEIDYIPGVRNISTEDLMTFMKESYQSQGSVLTRLFSISFEQVKKADFILHNTVQELESGILSTLSEYQPNYAIGPVNFSKNLSEKIVISKSLLPESDCTSWLDSKPTGSVLYISFGSYLWTSNKVVEEVAYALLLSKVSFIWVIRPGILDADDSNVLPLGFEDEISVKDKGLIIPWCDQISVLSSPAIGGFLTHNGWNSTFESMWCGVPMICFPISGDQPTNRKLVVDDWKIGINFCHYGNACVDRKEVAEKIRSLFSETNTSKSLRQEVNKVQKILQNAVDVDGSSERIFERFADGLRAKLLETSSNKK